MEVVSCKDVFSLYFTDSGVKYVGPCWFYFADLNAESSDYTRMILHDGVDTNGEIKKAMRCKAGAHDRFKPAFPVYFRNGVYVEAVNAFAYGFIQLIPG